MENRDLGGMMDHIYIKNCYVHDVNGNVPSSYHPDRWKMTGGIIFYSQNYAFNDLLVEDNHVKSVDHEGIRTKNASSARSSNVIIRNNYLEDIGGDAIVIAEVDSGGLVEYNISDGASQRSQGVNYAAIWAYQGTDNIIQYNSAINTGYAPNDGNGYDIDNGCDNITVQYNYSYNNDGGFILIMDGASNSVVRYNISENDRRRIIMTLVGTNIWFYNNTFYLDETMSTPIIERRTASLNPYYFYNNIVANLGSGDFISDSFYDAGGLISDYNNYWGNHPADEPAEPHKIISDPELAAPGTVGEDKTLAAAYRISSDSPCINSGLEIAGNGGKDYFNNPLYAGLPDIGAHEHPDGGDIYIPGQKPDGFDAAADAFVRDGSYSGTNFGTETVLTVKNDASGYCRKSYITFDFDSFRGDALSHGELNLFISSVNSDSSRTISIYGTADENWQENSITWNNAPSSTQFLTSFSVSPSDSGKWISIDISNYIRSNLDDKKISILLINEGTAGSKNNVDFSSRENAGDHPPVLTIAEGSTPVEYTFSPDADTYVRDGAYSSTNFGTDSLMTIKTDAAGYNRKSFIRFDFSTFPKSQASSAVLRLFVSNVNSAPNRTLSFYLVDDDSWGETSLNWNNMPVPGLKITDRIITATDSGDWIELDITSALNGEFPDKTISIAIINEGITGSKVDCSFSTRETANDPVLVIAE